MYRFLSAERLIGREPRFLEETNNTCDEFLNIAHDALWLLQNPNWGRGLSSFQKKYHLLLANHGFVAQSGRLIISNLLQSFQEHYVHGLLKQLRCELSGSHSNDWLVLLSRNTTMMYPPVRHLLLMHFLGYTIETFLKLPMDQLSIDQPPPFGDGPWPCLNPICPHYLERCIPNCEVIYRNMIDSRPRGKLTCECGFTYSRIGQDRSEEDLFRSSRIKIYGPLWEAKLKELWEDPSVSLTKATQVLGLTKDALRRQAKRLGLLSPEAVSQPASSQEAESNYWVNNHAVNGPNPALRERYREIWLSTKDANPEDVVTQLRNKIPKIHRWLYANDRDWLLSHSPTRQRKYPNRRSPASFVDWKERDEQVVIEIRSLVLLRNNASNRPIQVKAYTIAKKVEQDFSIWKNLNKLPLTAQAITELAETDEAFALRRVQWVIESYKQENRFPSKSQFLRKGNLQESQAKWISVKNAIEDAMRAFGANKD